MARNSKRADAPPGPDLPTRQAAPTPVPPSPAAGLNPAQDFTGLNFVVPTEFVDLPSGGKFYPPDSPLHGVSSVEIRHMTAKEEDILVNDSYIEKGIVFEKLINSILVDKSLSFRDFLVGDQNAIIIKARITGFGPEYQVSMACGSCLQEANFNFDLNENTVEDNTLNDEVTLDHSTGTFKLELPRSKFLVTVRLLTGADEKYLLEQKERLTSLGLEYSETLEYLKHIIVGINSVEDREVLNNLIEALPALDSRKIKRTYSEIMPSLNTRQKVACSKCGKESEMEVPFTVGFFWPDI